MAQARRKTTQKKIIDKAEKLLWLQGYEGTSLNDVVGKAGVSKGAFFHYYPNKQSISRDVINKYSREQLMAPLEKQLSEADSMKDALTNWVGTFFENFKGQNFRGGCLLGNMALELSDQNDHARETIKGHFLDLENVIASHLKYVEEEGRMNMEPRQFTRLLLASMQGATMMSKVHKDNNRASREFQAIAQLIEYAIQD